VGRLNDLPCYPRTRGIGEIRGPVLLAVKAPAVHIPGGSEQKAVRQAHPIVLVEVLASTRPNGRTKRLAEDALYPIESTGIGMRGMVPARAI
jgi:hypothetical protein